MSELNERQICLGCKKKINLLVDGFRCLDCPFFFCRPCAEYHFGKTDVSPVTGQRDHEVDIGNDILIRWDEDGEGFRWKHPECRAWSSLRLTPDPKSTGHVRLSGGREDMANFSIGGSLLCPMGCGKHGFITGGRWVVG